MQRMETTTTHIYVIGRRFSYDMEYVERVTLPTMRPLFCDSPLDAQRFATREDANEMMAAVPGLARIGCRVYRLDVDITTRGPLDMAAGQ